MGKLIILLQDMQHIFVRTRRLVRGPIVVEEASLSNALSTNQGADPSGQETLEILYVS